MHISKRAYRSTIAGPCAASLKIRVFTVRRSCRLRSSATVLSLPVLIEEDFARKDQRCVPEHVHRRRYIIQMVVSE